MENYHAPEFNSNASEFHVTLWNLNYDMDVIKDDPRVVKAPEEVVKEAENVVKAKTNVTKEFVKAYSGDIRSLFWLLSLPSLAKTEHSHPLGMVVSTHFRCGKGVKRGLKNGALPFTID